MSSPATSTEDPAQSRRPLLILLAMLALFHFEVGLTVRNLALFPTTEAELETQFLDEFQHVSFVMRMRQDPSLFPDYEDMRDVGFDDQSRFDGPHLHLRHPSFYYLAMSVFVDPNGATLLDNAMRLRLVNALISLLAVGLLLFAAQRLFSDPAMALGFAATVVLCPKVGFIAGLVNNDNLALLGGAVALIGLVRAAEGDRGVGTAALLGAGFAVAALAKLTAGLLVGIGILALHFPFWREMAKERRTWLYIGLLGALALIGVAPYLANIAKYGFPIYPAPGLPSAPVEERVALDWLGFLGWFFRRIGYTWTHLNRDAFDLLGLVAVVGIALFGAWKGEGAAGRVARAGLVAVGLVLLVNYAFTFKNHVQHGYMYGMHFRYYLPMWGAVALGVGLGVGRIPDGWARWGAVAMLSALLIWGHAVPLATTGLASRL